MNRYEFIESLRAALSGKVTQSTLNDNVRYYEEYLDSEIRKGRTEEEVIRELGNPRLLAKTIVEANKQSNQWGRTSETYSDTVDFGEEKKQAIVHMNGKEYKFPKWAGILVLVLIIVAVIAVVATVLSVLLPILLPIILIVMAVNIIAILLRK